VESWEKLEKGKVFGRRLPIPKVSDQCCINVTGHPVVVSVRSRAHVDKGLTSTIVTLELCYKIRSIGLD
jgi:hypothetical protein